MKSLVLTVKADGDEREHKASEERRLAEDERRLAVQRECAAYEERRKAEEERRKAEEERHKADQERRKAEEREYNAVVRNQILTSQINTNILTLRKEIALRVVPRPINHRKRHRLSLYKSTEPNQQYISCCQMEGWHDAHRRLIKKHFILHQTWDDISHAIDIGNTLKRQCRNLKWNARGNILETPRDYDVKQAIVNIVTTYCTCID